MNKKITFSFCFILLLGYLYTPLTNDDIMLDYGLIIEPLKSINGINDYINAVKAGSIYDFQPIRDLSHLIDLYLEKKLDFPKISMIHNFLLLFISGFLLFRIFNYFYNEDLSLKLAAIFLLHPLTFHIFIEATNRKHILSFLGLILSFYFLLSNKKKLSWGTYLLSGFSHPINIFSPFFFGLIDYAKNKKVEYKAYIPFALILLSVFVVNYYHYSNMHYGKMGMENIKYKYDISSVLFSISLHFRQFFYPTSFSTYYSLENLSVLISLLFIPIISWLVIKSRTKYSLGFSFLLLSVFFILYGHKSNVLSLYILNTYILTPSFVFLFYLGQFEVKYQYFKYLTRLFLLVIPFISFYFSSLRINKYEFYKSIVEDEPTCRVLQVLLNGSIKNGYESDITKYGHTWLEKKCNIIGGDLGYSKAFINTHLIFLSKDFSFDEKVNLISSKFPQQIDSSITKASLYIKYVPSQKNEISNILQNLNYQQERGIFVSKSFFKSIIENYCHSNDDLAGCISYKNYMNRIKDLKEIKIQFNKNI